MRKKGFTLVELLAVIVVLAIIALIAVPMVLNIIERAREGAAKSSAMSYIKATETYIVTSKLDNKMEQLQAGETYTTSKLNNLVELKGTKPSDGTVVISNKNSVASATLIINGYTIIYNGEDYIVNKGDNGECVNGVLNNITLTEKEILVGFPESISKMEKYVDEALEKIITSGIGIIDTTELTELKNATYTWSSSNADIIEISGDNVIGKKVGKATIIATTSKGQEIRILVDSVTGYFLADKVAIGDYVAYDAGNWAETVAKPPASPINFGGYIKDKNKANSVEWCYQETYTTELKGWRVLKIDKSTNTVTLVHAGHPECYYYAKNQQISSINELNKRATDEYLNNTYAQSAHMMNTSEAKTITGNDGTTTNDLRYIGLKGTTTQNSPYWLAGATYTEGLDSVHLSGDIYTLVNSSRGIRPVIVLKSGIKTTGKTTDAVGQEAWNLVAP